MQTVLLVIQLLVAIALVAVILLQKTAADGGGLAGGSTMGGLFTARGSANFLTRLTAILATAFIVICLVLGAMASRHNKTGSIVDQIAPVAPAEQSAPKSEAPKAPSSGPTVPLAK